MVTNRSNSNTDKEPLLNEIKHTGDTLHTMNPRDVVPDSNYNTNITIDQLQNTNSAEGDKVMTTNVEEQLTTHTKRTFPWKKLITALLLISVLTFVIIDSLTTKYVYTAFQSFLTWVSNNLVAGVFAFMGVYCIATIAFIPGSILTLGGGFVFGTAVGLGPGVALASAAVFVGASLGAIGSFLLGRYLLRDWVGRRLVGKYPLITALDEGEPFANYILLFQRIFFLLPNFYSSFYDVYTTINNLFCLKLLLLSPLPPKCLVPCIPTKI